jgi:hypothetical protein
MPTEAKTLEELLIAFQEVIPELHKAVENVIIQNPDVTTPSGDINIDKIVAIAVMDFLCVMFGKPHLGYMRTYPKN